MSDDLQAVAARPHITIMAAGDWVYVYSGYNAHTVQSRAQDAAVGMIAGNLDVTLTSVEPARFEAIYRRLVAVTGADNVSLMPYPERPRRCLVCAADLTDDMGVYVFVAGRSATDGDPLVCVGHGNNGANHLGTQTYLRLREIDEGRPYPPADPDEAEPMTRARQLGHDPVFDGVRGLRWTCRRCHRAVLQEGAQVYGSAIEQACVEAGSLQWRP